MSDSQEANEWMEKMKDALFSKHTVRKDGMVEAEVKDNVYDIIMDRVPKDKPLTASQFNALLIEVSIEISKYLLDNVEDLSSKLASSFAFDFVTQLLMAAASVEFENDDPDPMFG